MDQDSRHSFAGSSTQGFAGCSQDASWGCNLIRNSRCSSELMWVLAEFIHFSAAVELMVACFSKASREGLSAL